MAITENDELRRQLEAGRDTELEAGDVPPPTTDVRRFHAVYDDTVLSDPDLAKRCFEIDEALANEGWAPGYRRYSHAAEMALREADLQFRTGPVTEYEMGNIVSDIAAMRNQRKA